MKKFTKSVIAMLLMCCMLFGLTACGNGNTNNQGDTNVTSTPAPTKAPDDTATPTEAPVADDEPKEIVTIKYGTH